MKRILAIFLILLSFGCTMKTDISTIQSVGEKSIVEGSVDSIYDEMLQKMTLTEKIGQMLIVADENSDTMTSELRDMLGRVKPGGFILFGGNITTYSKTLELVKQIKNTSDIPMFISIDEEGGEVQRLLNLEDSEVSDIPSMARIGAMGDVSLATKIGRVIGEELRVFGINMNFAPVLDVYSNKRNKIIGERSFGSEPEIVGKMGISFAMGQKSTGIIPVYKHFPGHGNTETDSHFALPVVKKEKEELWNFDLLPFRMAVSGEAIMVGHLAVPSLDSSNTPATLSSEIISVLKDDIGFQGLIVSDALNMNALQNNYTESEIYIKAIEAGIDLLLMPPHPEVAVKTIEEAVYAGRLDENRIDESVKKILTLKAQIADDYDEYADRSFLASEEHREVINSIP